jgi:hypothetical protein
MDTAVLKFGAAHFARLSLVGPWHLTVAVSQTSEAPHRTAKRGG